MYKTSVIWLSLLLSLVLGGCTMPAVRQAEAVVAQADSLWQAGKMYGIDEGDSATLAQACETLSTFNSPLLSTFNYQLSTDFSRLCYHYGRLLREKDNPAIKRVPKMSFFGNVLITYASPMQHLCDTYARMFYSSSFRPIRLLRALFLFNPAKERWHKARIRVK